MVEAGGPVSLSPLPQGTPASLLGQSCSGTAFLNFKDVVKKIRSRQGDSTSLFVSTF